MLKLLRFLLDAFELIIVDVHLFLRLARRFFLVMDVLYRLLLDRCELVRLDVQWLLLRFTLGVLRMLNVCHRFLLDAFELVFTDVHLFLRLARRLLLMLDVFYGLFFDRLVEVDT